MKNFLTILLLIVLSTNLFCFTADEIVEMVDKNLMFDEGEMLISILDYKDEKLYKTLKTKIYYKKDKGTLMEFLEPAREKGKKILLVKDNMWLFVPSVSKPLRLSAKDSFMGTSFSNRDLMDYDLKNDYKAKILQETEKYYKLELTATNKNVAYPKVIIEVEKQHVLPTKEELYTLSGDLIKIIEFSGLKNFSGKTRPSIIKVVDMLNQKNYTKVVLENLENKPIKDSMFLPQNFAK
jgi:outer membrane lipoprotein-sorting protein